MFDEYKMKMLNKRASSKDSKSSEVIENLEINPGDTVGDIGAGGGFFSLELSKEVGGNGKVYAADVSQKSLDYIDQQNKGNVKTVLVDSDRLVLPESVDMFFLRNVFHHLPEPVDYFKNLSLYLKEDGKVAVIDYKKKGFSFMGLFGHFTSEEDIIKILDEAGFTLYRRYDFLPEQSFVIFKLKN